MGRLSDLVLAALLSAAQARAAALPKPAGLKAEFGGAQLQVSWEAVPGAELYRVAVFAPVDSEGKRPLQAAVWVKAPRSSYLYGKDAVVPKAGALPSTKPLPLELGLSYRVMVAAARAAGADKSEWAATDATAMGRTPDFARQSPTPSPTLSPSPTPEPSGEDAELVVDADEFKAKPDAAVLDVGDHAEGAESRAALVDAASSTPSASAATSTAAPLPDTAQGVRDLLKTGRAEQAESAARAMLAKDATEPDSWELLGDSLALRKLKVEAMEAYEKALAIDPKRKHLREWIDTNTRR